MELKHHQAVNNPNLMPGFNRTFMELKRIKINIEVFIIFALIGPLWN